MIINAAKRINDRPSRSLNITAQIVFVADALRILSFNDEIIFFPKAFERHFSKKESKIDHEVINSI